MAIDPSALQQIVLLDQQTGGGLIEELVGMFLHGTPKRLAALAEAVARGDAPTAERELHSIRGSAGALGATDFMALAGVLERSARSRELAEVAAGLSELQQSFSDACTLLEAERARLGVL
jgi:HPt (histidine-containing phosphotransfer) domain-containing protein